VSEGGRRTKFDIKREATYEALVDAGMHVFAEKGYSAARVEDVVERTGQTKGAFYFHFKNKLDLLAHVIEHRDRRRAGWEEVLDTIPAGASVVDVVGAVMRELDSRTDGIGPVWIMVMVGAFHQHQGDPEVEALFRASYERFLDGMTVVVDFLKERGLIDGPRTSRTLAAQIFALAEGYGTHMRMYRLTDPAPMVEGIVKLLS
jgi:AcrR family transcriptional regulator